ncbi:hypothetical protein HZA44_04265, partial [Candidatus Peregrinibacteria bacterium]|nr:hypothetical protein [Candidatus Peregrinibacteria bacterium]
MKTPKVMIAFLTLSALVTQSFAPSAQAASTYEPDNSLRADPLQSSKQMGGNLEVGEFTGAAIYNYPIALPAGRNGMAPSVQLTYNSQDSALDNIAGFHWSLNTASIKRINKKGVEKLYDRNDFVANGPFGGGELIPTALDDGHHGQYGEKNERSFAQYEYLADNSWRVTDKRGTRYTFGAMEEGRQFDPADGSRTFQWMLEEVRDLNGNGIVFTYFRDGNQLYPKTIRYTNHGAEEGIFEVRFLPFADGSAGASRIDSHTSFAEGFQVDTQRLVTGIEVKAEGQLRRKFEIGYSTVDPLTKNTIGRITETGYDLNGNATILPATTFDYTPSVVHWGETTDYIYPGYFQTCYTECESTGATWDMNGDGLTDFETVQNGAPQRFLNNGKNGWSTTAGNLLSINQPSLPNLWSKPIDFDGDNSNEIVTSYSSQIDGLTHSTIQSSSRPAISDTIAIPFALPSYGMNDNGASVADLNGDGLPDILQSHSYFYSGTWSSTSTTDKATCLNQDGNSCVDTNLWEAPVIFVSASGTQQSARQHYVQDCNTDGLADVVYTGSGGGNWINDGKGGWIPNATRCDLPPMDSLTTRSLDANGDG